MMIVYNLSCDQDHNFEGWFASPGQFDKQQENKQISCPTCGSTNVTKQLSAPYVNVGAATKTSSVTKQTETALAGLDPQHLQKKFIEYIIQNTEDVGAKFPDEARKIYYGETDKRSIRGQASSDAIKELQEEGIEVYGLPADPPTPDKLN
ncbi:DUF1178 family protein [Burkholderiales bacterium]|nr:DUF1178 family protein [Burkholderiales bacterium]